MTTEEQHAKYSPSQLKRIIACPASVHMSEGMVDEGNEYAEEGTMLHEVMAESLTDFIIRDTAYPKVIIPSGQELTNEQTRAIEDCFDYFLDIYRPLELVSKPVVSLEVKTSLSYLGFADCYGTADAVIREPTKGDKPYRIHVIDWKFGHVVEEVKDNPQLMAYALGSFESMTHLVKHKEVVTHIVQPRLNNMSSFTYSIAELIKQFNKELALALRNAMNADTFCTPGAVQCQWCLANGICRARFEPAMATAQDLYKVYAKPTVTNNEVRRLYDRAKELDRYIKDIKQRALALALSGQDFPGQKLVLGRSSRKWKDKKQAAELLNAIVDQGEYVLEFDDLYVSKFVTVPQMEKLARGLKKDKRVLDAWRKFDGKPTLVPVTDKREEYQATATKVFQDFVEKKD